MLANSLPPAWPAYSHSKTRSGAIAERARLVQQQTNGAMLSVQLPEHEVRAIFNGSVSSGSVSIAAINTPTSCVLAGPIEAIDAAEQKLTNSGVSNVRLQTSHAFHSSMMDPVVPLFTEVLQRVPLRVPQIPYISNVTAQWTTPADATDPNYWAVHLRRPVRFAEGVAQFMQDPTVVLLEVGPGKTLTSLARQHPERKLEQAVVNSQAKGEELEALLAACGRLWLAGVSLDTNAFFGDELRQRLSLPAYPFERKRYWIEPDGTEFGAAANRQRHRTSIDCEPNPSGRANGGNQDAVIRIVRQGLQRGR